MKKLIALVAVIALMTSMLCINASAELFFCDDFDNPPSSGDLRDVPGWSPYTAGMEGGLTFEDGKLGINNSPGTSRPFWRKTYTASPSHVLTFDVMYESDKIQASWQMWLGNTSERQLYNDLRSSLFKPGVWFNVMIIVNDCESLSMYIKQANSTDGVWKHVHSQTRGNAKPADTTWFRIGHDIGKNAGDDHLWLDNFMAYNDVWFDKMNISLDDAEVEEIADVIYGGTISFDFDLYDANISLDGDMKIEENTTAKTVVVALDKDMKMVGCSTVNIPIKGGKNNISASLELSDDEAAANYYGNLADGGQINLYMWNNMQPLCDPIVID